MGKLVTIFLLTALLVALASDRVIAMPEAASTTAQMPRPLHPAPGKVFQNPGEFYALEFYVHEIGTGPNQTVWNAAFSEITLTSPSSFGLIQVVDNLITAGPELDSHPLGRVQGTLSFSDLHQTALSVNLNLIFREDVLYRGGTLSVQGRLPVSGESGELRELSIVGGTGSFWLPRGIAIINNYSFDPSTLHRVSLYSVHYATGPLPPIRA